jgi:hypothetical protein
MGRISNARVPSITLSARCGSRRRARLTTCMFVAMALYGLAWLAFDSSAFSPHFRKGLP